MDKVLVERPRRGKGGYAQGRARRNDIEGPQQLGMRAGYTCLCLNENLSPLRRYLHAQLGRPWNKVFSEIAAGIDRRNTVQQHIFQHLEQFIATQVELQGGQLVDLRARGHFCGAQHDTISQPLYVDPRTGLIRENKAYHTWRRRLRDQRRAEQAEVESRRRVIDASTVLLKLDGEWFEVTVASLPEERVVETKVDGQRVRKRMADGRYDIILKRMASRGVRSENAERIKLYGSHGAYAVAKRQLSRREMKSHGLR